MVPSTLEKQTYEVPDSRRPGQTGIYRSAAQRELVESISPEINNVYQVFQRGLSLSKDGPCLGHRPLVNGKRGRYVWQSYRQVNRRITDFGSGLLNIINDTLGDSRTSQIPIGIWSLNRPEWLITDLGCAAYNLYTVALYDTLGPDTVEYVINHAEIETVVCSADHITDLLKLKGQLPKLRVIISMDSLQDTGSPNGAVSDAVVIKAWAEERGVQVFDFETLEKLGRKSARAFSQPQPDDLACLMYTSGTTGHPKGAMISHRNIVSALSASFSTMEGTSEDVSISYLPLAHIFGRVGDLVTMCMGGRLGFFSGSMDTLTDDIQELKPTIMITVPRLLNRIYAAIVQNTTDAPGIKGAIAQRAVAAKLANLENGQGYTHALWDRVLFNKVKMALGGRVRTMVTGSAPIGKDVLQFLRIALVCDIREGYGATETSAATTVHTKGESTAGHIGAPFPCNEIKLLDVPEMDYFSTDPYPRGEICVRGPNVFLGYYKDEEKTREAIDDEGWFHTGDVGMVNERGCFVVIDRKKNIFKLAQGEYIAPEKIENIYAKNPIVGQIYLHGDSLQSALVAVVVPDPEALKKLVAAKLPRVAAKKLSLEHLCQNEEVTEAVLAQLTRTGKKASIRGFEFAKAIWLEPVPFSIENDLLTPTLKVKRAQAHKHYEQQIADMYASLQHKVKAKL